MSLTDNFNRADGDPGANWTDTHGAGCSIATNVLKGDSPGDYAGTRYSGSAWANDHSSQVLVVAVGYAAPAVRMSAGPNWYCYHDDGTVEECIGGGTPAAIASFGLISATETSRLVATGTTLEGFNGAVSQGTVVDASLSSGAPGVIFYDNGQIDDWVGSDGAAPVAALTGTVTASITEADIVTGGKTIILTLTSDTYIAN